MKSLFRLVLPVMTLSLAACSGGGSESSIVDSNQNIKIQQFTSADRSFADLRGDVRECVRHIVDMELQADTLVAVPDSPTTTVTQKFNTLGQIESVLSEDSYMDMIVGRSLFAFEFDSIGNLLSSSTDLGGRMLVKRDKDGYVSTFTCIDNSGDVDYTQIYKWADGRLVKQQMANDRQPLDQDGNPVAVPSDHKTFDYDNNGFLVAESEEMGDPDLQITVTNTAYEYLDLDSVGNWTSRNVKRLARVYEVKPSRQRVLADSVATYQRESRQISYF